MLENLEREPLSTAEINRELKFCNKHIIIGHSDDNFVRIKNLEIDNCKLEIANTRVDVLRLTDVVASVLVIDCLRIQRLDLIGCKIERLIVMSSTEASMYLTSFNVGSSYIQEMEVQFNSSYSEDDYPRIYMDLSDKAVIKSLILKNTNDFKFDFYLYSDSMRTLEHDLSSNSMIDSLYLEGFNILELAIPSLCMSLNKAIIGPNCSVTDVLCTIPEMEINLSSNEDYPSALRSGILKNLGMILERHSNDSTPVEEVFLKPLATLGGLYKFFEDLISNPIMFDDLTLKMLYPFIKIKEKTLVISIAKNETLINIRKEIRGYDPEFRDFEPLTAYLHSVGSSMTLRKGEIRHLNTKLHEINLRASQNAGFIFLQTTK